MSPRHQSRANRRAAIRRWLPGLAGATLLLAAAGGLWAWSRRPPLEYRTLEAVVRRLSQGNDLGRQPIAFMIGAGTYTADLAQQRGLCKPERCEFFAQLDPYRTYGNGWDELVRIGYALGDIQGWSASSGTVVLPRAAFRAYGPRVDYLSCTVAHEIAHLRLHHVFEQSRYDAHHRRGLSDQQLEERSMARSRQLELEADRVAADMLARAGYRGRVCLHELEFMFRSVGDGSSTEPGSTHPGYEERIAAMKAHYAALEKRAPRPERSTPGQFRYDRGDNLLTFAPAAGSR